MASERSTRRLGRGLDALLGAAGREPLRGSDPAAARHIPVDGIRANPIKPRREY
jgi:hypothetical protein